MNEDLLTLFQSDNFIFSQMHLDVHKYFFKVSFQLLIGFKHTISKSSRSNVITFINAFMLTSWTIIKVIKMFTVTIGKSDQMINSVWLILKFYKASKEGIEIERSRKRKEDQNLYDMYLADKLVSGFYPDRKLY